MSTMTNISKFHAFNKSETVYKTTIRGRHEIGVSVFVPKDAGDGAVLPVLIRWHGGALLAGARDHEPWFPTCPQLPFHTYGSKAQAEIIDLKRIIDLAAHHSAILITPDYQLLPESPGTAILEDVQDFFTWVKDSLPSHLGTHSPTHTADLNRILITGESAGGYMALQSALLAEIPGLRAVIAHYPMLDLRSSHFSVPGRKDVWGKPAPELPEGWLEQQLKGAKTHEPVSSRIPREDEPDLFVALLEAGRYTDVLGSKDELFPMENLGRKGKLLAPLWVLHGAKDTVIPLEGTLRFVEKARQVFEGQKLDLSVTVVEGEEHGFDNENAKLETGWVKEGRVWLQRYWP